MSYIIYEILEILRLGISELESKHDHLSIRYFWRLRLDHIHKYDMNQPN